MLDETQAQPTAIVIRLSSVNRQLGVKSSKSLVLSELNSLIEEVDNDYNNYEPTRAGRAIAEFVDAHLSNWYVRLSRRRFWKSDVTSDKTSAYQTLYTCLDVLAKISSPIAPFFAERLYQDLNAATGREAAESVHLTDFPKANQALIDKDLEERMEMAQLASSMVLFPKT